MAKKISLESKGTPVSRGRASITAVQGIGRSGHVAYDDVNCNARHRRPLAAAQVKLLATNAATGPARIPHRGEN